VLAVWRRAQNLGFLGPGPVEHHLDHAAAFRDAVPVPPALGIDLGSGGGVPGLALALWWPASRWVLIDAGERRAVFLADAVETLDLADRITVVHRPAESAGRDPALRGAADLVVARSFGPPAVVAECAAPLLRVCGRLVVSEPPDLDPARWPAEELEKLGLILHNRRESSAGSVVVLEQASIAGGAVPRRSGLPARRPLW
jgi:16S rRNA (guanine527-N7)-methyltransferase